MNAPVRGKCGEEGVTCGAPDLRENGNDVVEEGKGLVWVVAGKVGGYNGTENGRVDGEVE